MADTLTLEDLGYEFKIPDTDINDYLNNLITVYTKFTEIPEKLKNGFLFFNEYYDDLFTANLEDLADKFNTYYNNNIVILKEELTKSLSLDSDTIYDIHVKNAEEAKNAKKFNNKTYNEMITEIVSVYITPASVSNSLKFNNKTQDEYDNHIINDLKVKNATNADTLDGMDFTTIKNSILTDISDSGGSDGVTLSEIKSKVEDTWTAHKAKDTEKFNGMSQSEYDNHIASDVKVDNAINAEKFNGTTYSDMITGVNTMIQNNIDTAISADNTDLINIIKNTKVLASENADSATLASNSLKFNNMTQSEYDNHIISSVKVNNAINADKFNGLSQTEWENKISDAKDDVISQVKTSITAYKAQTVEKIGDYDVANYDDHIKDIAAGVVASSGDGSIDADTLQGYSYGDIITNVIATKVDNAVHADSADQADNLVDGEGTLYSIGDIHIYSDNKIANLNDYSTDEGKKFFEYAPYNIGLGFIDNFTDTTNSDDEVALLSSDSIINGFKNKKFIYNDNNEISTIEYYTHDDYKFRRDDFEYDDGNITKITINISSKKDTNTGTVVIENKFTYDDNGNITEITNSTVSTSDDSTDL